MVALVLALLVPAVVVALLLVRRGKVPEPLKGARVGDFRIA